MIKKSLRVLSLVALLLVFASANESVCYGQQPQLSHTEPDDIDILLVGSSTSSTIIWIMKLITLARP